jgi:putative peptidoglycan lipid II flippase
LRLTLRRQDHPAVGQIGRMLIPRVVGSSVYQVSVLIDTVFASFHQFVGPGGVAALYFANRFLHLPLALFGISMAQAALPTMAAHVAAQDLPAIRRTCLLALRSSLFIAIPAGIGLIVLGAPIIRILLQRGAFSFEATAMTVGALQGYAVGVASLCAVKVLANTLYAFHDTWTPVRSAAMALGLNVVLNLILIGPFKLAGLALATSLSSSFNMLHLYRAVCRRIGPMGRELKPWAWRVLAASVGMGLFVHGVWRMLIPSMGLAPWMGLAGSGALALLVTILLGIGTFFGLAWLLRIEESRRIAGWLSRRG